MSLLSVGDKIVVPASSVALPAIPPAHPVFSPAYPAVAVTDGEDRTNFFPLSAIRLAPFSISPTSPPALPLLAVTDNPLICVSASAFKTVPVLITPIIPPAFPELAVTLYPADGKENPSTNCIVPASSVLQINPAFPELLTATCSFFAG